ncbi:MAG TPA: ABC transporter permease, partial [Opitutaceae bacterium]|nr:ABC transporter permease [Opitutaceae bacterium]
STIFDSTRSETLALASESFSERFRVNRGDRIAIPTPAGPHTVTLEGIFADYGNERGSILVERKYLVKWFSDNYVTNVSLWVKPSLNAEAVRAELLERWPGLSVYTNGKLRTEILRIFHQTFSITYALEIIGVTVAVVGLALTLASVLLDRRDELTTLRALGFTHREIALATSIEGFAVTVTATFGGTLVSLALGWLLIYVVNKQSFGWTLGFALPWTQLAALATVVIATGTAVAYAVGLKGAVLPADQEE